MRLAEFSIKLRKKHSPFEPDFGFWVVQAKKIFYFGNSEKPSYLCFQRHYEIVTKLLDIEDSIEQSALNLESIAENDNDEISDLNST